MAVKETIYPALAVNPNAANWLAAIAADSLALLKLVPPQPRLAPVPLVPTPDPRVRPVTVRLGPLVARVSGEMPKLFAPPGSEWRSQPASTPV